MILAMRMRHKIWFETAKITMLIDEDQDDNAAEPESSEKGGVSMKMSVIMMSWFWMVITLAVINLLTQSPVR